MYAKKGFPDLNLPVCELRLAGTAEHPTVFDQLRNRYVALTPEEWVRQHFVNYLIAVKSYPITRLANEILLRVGDKTLRADSVVYDADLQPKMIVEYKAPTVKITQKTFDQISAYNTLLHVDYLVVSNGLTHFCCQINHADNQLIFIDELPDYQTLTKQ